MPASTITHCESDCGCSTENCTVYTCGYCGCCCGCPSWDRAELDSSPRATRRAPFRLNSYSYTPHLEFRGDGPRYLGMEMEVTADSDTFGQANDLLEPGGVYLKSDGSVCGFEAVTHPMTYQWAMDNFPWEALPELERLGCSIERSSNGIHVHMSRAGFDSGEHLHKWLRWFYANQQGVTRIARRTSNRWGPFDPQHANGHYAHSLKHGLTYPNMHQDRLESRGLYDSPEAPGRWEDRNGFIWDNQRRTYSDDGTSTRGGWYLQWSPRLDREARVRSTTQRGQRLLDRSGRNPEHRSEWDSTLDAGRYQAVNTTNEHTLEVRVFASTLEPAEARACLALCDASEAFAADLPEPDTSGWHKAAEWDRFIRWCKRDGNYPDLVAVDKALR